MSFFDLFKPHKTAEKEVPKEATKSTSKDVNEKVATETSVPSSASASSARKTEMKSETVTPAEPSAGTVNAPAKPHVHTQNPQPEQQPNSDIHFQAPKTPKSKINDNPWGDPTYNVKADEVIANNLSSEPEATDGLDQLTEPANPLTTEQSYKPQVMARPIFFKFSYQGEKVANDFVAKGQVGQEVLLKDLPRPAGFLYTQQVAESYRITDHTQHITLNLIPSEITYDLIPVTEDRKLIDQKYVKQVRLQPGTSVPFSQLVEIPGYQAYTTRVYLASEETQQIEIMYSPVPQSITVLFTTLAGETLAERTLQGKTGDHYELDPGEHHFEGYELVDEPENLSGIFSAGPQIITLKYRPISSTVTINFLDEAGNALHRPLSYDGSFGQSYSINLPQIDGYELISDPQSLVGTFANHPKQVALKFTRAEQNFKVHFWFDKELKQSAGEDKIITGLTNNDYKYPVPQIDGYQAAPDVITGRFSPFGNSDVDVVYSPIPSLMHVALQDEAGRPISGAKPLEVNGQVGKTYEIQLPEIPGYIRPETTISGKHKQSKESLVVHYQPTPTKLTINYINLRTKQPIADLAPEVHSGLMGTTYSFEPKVIDGYQLVGQSGNVSGTFSQPEETINLSYQPNPSKIIVNQLDQAHNEALPSFTLTGYYGEPYSIQPAEKAGFNFDSASDELAGTFPTNQKTINLYYTRKMIKFTIMPVDQFKEVIDPQVGITISGIVDQRFSTGLPKIAGYTSPSETVSGTLRSERANQTIKIQYQPEETLLRLHFICQGGPMDTLVPFDDFELPGLVGDPYEYDVPTLQGYTPNQTHLNGKFDIQPTDLEIVYAVNSEQYTIAFVDEQQQLIEKLPPATGDFGTEIDVTTQIPAGYHLPSGSQATITLDSSEDYNLTILPDTLTVELHAIAEDGTDLEVNRQITGLYHQFQTVEAPTIPGYTPVNGNEVTVNFELGEDAQEVSYAANPAKLTVRFMDTQGTPLKPIEVINGRYGQAYHVDAPKLEGYVIVGDPVKQGNFGLNDLDTAFIFRAGSDELSKAITPLDDLLDQSSQSNQKLSVPEDPATKTEAQADTLTVSTTDGGNVKVVDASTSDNQDSQTTNQLGEKAEDSSTSPATNKSVLNRVIHPIDN